MKSPVFHLLATYLKKLISLGPIFPECHFSAKHFNIVRMYKDKYRRISISKFFSILTETKYMSGQLFKNMFIDRYGIGKPA